VDLRLDAVSGLRVSDECAVPHATTMRSLARWPSLAYPWLPAGERRAGSLPELSPDCRDDALAAQETLRIEGAAEGSAITRAPNSPTPPQVRLRALGTQARVRWLVNGELAGESRGSNGFVHAFATAGDQRITALADSGAWAELNIRVLR
jgi:penicillin-binding protein 1C